MRARVLLALGLVVMATTSALGLAQKRLEEYRRPPFGACKFVQEQFGATPDRWQEQVLVAAVDPTVRRIALKACAGPGKTTVEAWIGWYFLGTRCTKGEHPNGLATSITGENLRDNLWKECAKWQPRSEYLRAAFTWTSNRIFAKDHEATWFLAARKWPKTASADEQGRTFSGLHGANVLVLIDESGAIPSTILRAAEQAVGQAAHYGLVLQGGNPISLEGMLHEACTRLRDQWFVVTVSGDPEKLAAWVNEPRTAALHRGPKGCACPACWARQQLQTYGRENPWVKAYILGEFPPQSLNALLSLEEVEASMARRLRDDEYAWAQKRIGVDVARFGDDRTVIFPRQGLRAFRPVVMRNARTTNIAARIAHGRTKWNAELVLVDDTGHWGHGVIDNLIAAGVPAIPVLYHDQAIDQRYHRMRSYLWMTMAEHVRSGLWLPEDPEMIPELITPTYTFVDGRFKVEDKEFVKQRLGRSPDKGDALANTYMLPDMPGELTDRLARRLQERHGGGRVVADYDPLAGDRL